MVKKDVDQKENKILKKRQRNKQSQIIRINCQKIEFRSLFYHVLHKGKEM